MEERVKKYHTLDEKNPFHSLLKTSLPLTMLPNRELLKINPEHFYIIVCKKFWNENKVLFE